MNRTYVDEQKIGISAGSCDTCGNLLPQASYTAHAISNICLLHVRSGLTQNKCIEEVICEIHLGSRVPLRTVHTAVEGSICYIKRRFPDVGEFWKCRIGLSVSTWYKGKTDTPLMR
jgi:hypothetical protein